MRTSGRIPVIGVDVGKQRDPTAIVVVEIEVRPVKSTKLRQTTEEAHYLVRSLGRIPLGTDYPEVVRQIGRICRGVANRCGKPPILSIDATGVGLPVIDLLRASGPVVDRIDAVLFTGSEERVEQLELGRVLLGKPFMVSRLQALLQFGRIHLPPTSEANALAQELRDFEIRVDENAHQRSGAFRAGCHDDLVAALGLACQKEPIRCPSAPHLLEL